MALKEHLYEIVWSPRSLSSFENIVAYIEAEFGESSARIFVQKTMNIISLISRNPEMFRKSASKKNKHIVVVSKKTILYYQFKQKKRIVELLLFWDNRQNPLRLKY